MQLKRDGITGTRFGLAERVFCWADHPYRFGIWFQIVRQSTVLEVLKRRSSHDYVCHRGRWYTSARFFLRSKHHPHNPALSRAQSGHHNSRGRPIMNKRSYLFTSESVSEGHPDKLADRISDAVLDHIIAQDSMAKVASPHWLWSLPLNRDTSIMV